MKELIKDKFVTKLIGLKAILHHIKFYQNISKKLKNPFF